MQTDGWICELFYILLFLRQIGHSSNQTERFQTKLECFSSHNGHQMHTSSNGTEHFPSQTFLQKTGKIVLEVAIISETSKEKPIPAAEAELIADNQPADSHRIVFLGGFGVVRITLRWRQRQRGGRWRPGADEEDVGRLSSAWCPRPPSAVTSLMTKWRVSASVCTCFRWPALCSSEDVVADVVGSNCVD